MTNAQQYIARLSDKLDITEGAAREMAAQRAEDARKSAQPVERAALPIQNGFIAILQTTRTMTGSRSGELRDIVIGSDVAVLHTRGKKLDECLRVVAGSCMAVHPHSALWV